MKELFTKSILDTTEGLLGDARKGKNTNILLVLILPVLIMLVSGVILTGCFYIFAILSSFFPKMIQYSFQINLITSTSITIGLYFLFVKLVEKRSVSSLGLSIDRFSIFKYLRGFLIGLLMMEIVVVVIIGTGNGILEFNGEIDMNFLVPFFITLIAWVIQGASEEIMIRGHMLPKLGVKVGAWFAIIISSSYFGLLHLGNPGISKISILNLILFGIFSAIYAIKERGIIGVCAIHSAWNFAQGNIFGFLVSGLKAEGGTLISTTVTDNELITGGAFGPEGGLAVTIVLLVALGVVCICSFRNRDYKFKLN